MRLRNEVVTFATSGSVTGRRDRERQAWASYVRGTPAWT